MELAQFYQLIKNGKKTVLSSILVFMLFALAFTFFRPLEYQAQSRLLIIQNSQEGTDPFVAAKANEYLGGVLTKIVTSNSFLDEVLASGLNIDLAYFSNDQQQRSSTWESMVTAKSYGDLGVIEISVFHADKYQAEQIAQAIDLTLKNKSNVFLSTGDKVEIRVIDQPIVSKWPVRPNIILNMILGPIIGLIFSLFYIYLFAKVSIQPESAMETIPVQEPVALEPQPAALPVQQSTPEPVIFRAPEPTPNPPQAAPVVQPIIEPVAPSPAFQAPPQPAQPAAPAALPVTPATQPAAQPPANNGFDLDDILNQGNISNLL